MSNRIRSSARELEAAARQSRMEEQSRRSAAPRMALGLSAGLMVLSLASGAHASEPRRFPVEPDPPSQTTAIVVADSWVREGQAGTSVLRFRLAISPQSPQAVTVSYVVVDHTARLGDRDYEYCQGSLVIPANATSADVCVNVNGDAQAEPDESLWLMLTGADLAQIDDAIAAGTIVNDDARGGAGSPRRLPEGMGLENDQTRRLPFEPPAGGEPISLTVSDSSMPEGNSGTSLLRFQVNLSRASSEAITVQYRLVDQTARCGDQDFEAASGTLVIPAYAMSAEISVNVLGDELVEPNESFWLVISDVDNAQLDGAVAAGTILNDDRRGGAGGPRRLPEGSLGMEGDRQAGAAAPAKKNITWGGLKSLYR